MATTLGDVAQLVVKIVNHGDACEQATQLYSSEKYGSALAAGVTARLSTGAQMANSHRDYCGIGLAINGSIFVMAEVQDGYLETTLRTWATADEFKAWLAVQSDFAQSGFDPATGLVDAWLQGNQRITRQRLNDFVAAGGNEGTGRKDHAQGAKQKRKKGRI